MPPQINAKKISLDIPVTSPDLVQKKQSDTEYKEKLVKERSWLNGNHPLGKLGVSCDFQLFSLIDGDAFIKKSGHEGGDLETTTNFFVALLQQFLEKDFEFTRPFKTVLQDLQNHLHFCQKIHKAYNISEHSKRLYQENIDKEEVFLPLSYTNEANDSYNMILCINRTTKSVTVYGLKHPQMIEECALDPLKKRPEKAERSQQFLVIKNCDSERLNSPEFYTYILTLASETAKNKELEFDHERLYNGMKKFLRGTIEEPLDIHKHAALYRKAPRSKTSSVKGILDMIFYRLVAEPEGLHCYKKMKFLWQTRALLDVAENHLSRYRSEDFIIFNSIVENISRAAEKLTLDNLLSEDELASWNATRLDLQAKVKQFEAQATVAGTLEKLEVAHLTENKQLITFELHDNIDQAAASKKNKLQHDPSPYIKSFAALKKPNNSTDFSAWCQYLRQILDVKYISNAAFRDERVKVLDRAFEELLEGLPIPGNNCFWESYSAEDSKKVIKDIYNLVSTLKSRSEYNLSSSDITNYCLFSIVDALGRNCPDNNLKGYVFSTSRLFPVLEDDKNLGSFLIDNPIIDQKLTQAYRYLNRPENQQLFPNGSETITQKSTDDTLTIRFFKQFLTSESKSENEIIRLMLGESLPEGFSLVYRTYCQASGPYKPELRGKTIAISQGRLHISNIPNMGEFSELFFSNSQNEVVHESTHYFPEILDLDNSKKLAMLAIDSTDRANRAIAFFRKNLQLFQVDYAVNFFLSLFFQFNSTTHLFKEPNYIQIIKNFLAEAVAHFLQQNDIKTALRLVSMAQRIKTYLSKMGLTTTLPCYRTMILEEILPKYCNDNAALRCACLSELWGFYRETPMSNLIHSKEAMKDLVSYMLSKPSDPNIKITEPMLAQLAEWFNEDPSVKNEFLNHLIKIYNPSATPCEWSGTFPVFVGEHWSIDLGTMTHNVIAEAGFSVPSAILNHRVYSLFENKEVTSSISPDGIMTLSGNGIELKARFTGDEYHFYRNIEDKKYRLCTVKESKAVQDYSRGIIHDKLFLWKSLDKPYSILVQEGQKSIYRVPLDLKSIFNGKIEYEMSGLERLLDNARLVTYEELPDDLKHLKDFEELKHIHVFADPITKKIKDIQLQKQQLQFVHREFKGKSYLYCKQYPGFFLTKQSTFPVISSGCPTITLANYQHEQIVLLSRASVLKESPNKLLVFKVENDELAGDSVEAKLALILFYVKKSDYKKANELLEQLFFVGRITDRINLQDPSKDQRDHSLLQRIHEKLVHSEHPEVVSFALRLAMMELNNRQIHPLKKNEKSEGLCFDLQKYAEMIRRYHLNQMNSTYCRLSDEERVGVQNLIFAELDLLAAQGSLQVKNLIYEAFGLEKLKEDQLNQSYTRISLPQEYDLGRWKVTNTKVDSNEAMPSLDMFIDLKDKLLGYVPKLDLFAIPLLRDHSFFKNNLLSLYTIALSGTPEQKKRLSMILDINETLDNNAFKLIKFAFRIPAICPSVAYLKKLIDLNIRAYHFNMLYSVAYFFGLLPMRMWVIASLISIPIKNKWMSFISHITSIKNKIPNIVSPPPQKKWRKEKVTEITPLNLNVSSLKGIDSAFDTYFKKLVKRHLAFVLRQIPAEQPVLPETHSDPKVQRELKASNVNLGAYRKDLMKQRRDVTVVGDLKELHFDLMEKSKELTEKLKTQQQALLWQINHVPGHSHIGEIRKAGHHRHISWIELQQLSLEGNLEKFKADTALDEEQATIVFDRTAQLLVEGSRLHQLNSALTLATKAIGEQDEERQKLYLELLLETLEVRVSTVGERTQIERLWFEFANGYLYRQEQLEKIKEIIAHTAPQLQAEMPTGFGKSKCLVTTLNQYFSRLGKLVFNCCPSSLEMTNLRDWFTQMRKSFGLKSDYISFSRESSFTSTNLEFLYLTLLSHKKNKTSVTVRPESLRSLELHFSTVLDEARKHSSHAETNRKIEFFTLILQLLYTESWIVIDEEHVNLSPVDRLIYTLGRGINLPDRDIGVIEKLFEYMMEGPLLSLLNISTNNQCYVTDNQYKLAANHLADKFFEHFAIAAENKESFKNYVLGIDKKPPKWILEHKCLKEICLLKGELCYILAPSLKGKVDTNFGLSHLHIKDKDQIKEYAISYAGSNTPKETESSPSQFKNPHETVTKTYLTYLFKGLSLEQFRKLVISLQNLCKEETENGTPLENTKAVLLYNSIAPKNAPHLLLLKIHEIDRFAQQFMRHPKAIFYYIRHVINLQLFIYPETVISTAQDACGQFTNSLSISATPQETIAHGPETHFIPMKRGSSARVTHLFLTKCQDPNTIKILHGNSAKECLDEALDNMQENSKISSIIDVGAQFTGLSNLEIGQIMRTRLQNDKNVEGILFFDEAKGVFKILEMATGTIVDPSEVHITSEQRKTIYDQNRCVGSDNIHAIDEIALMMTGKDDIDSIGQAGGRMRQWERDQIVHVATHKKIADEVFKDKKKNIEDLYVYWTENKIRQRENLNFQSQVQQIDHIVRRGVLNSILGITYDENKKTYKIAKPDPKRAIAIHNKNRDVFITPESIDPQVLYANLDNSTKPLDFLTLRHERKVNDVKKLNDISEQEKRQMLDKLKKLPNNWKQLDFPENVPSAMDLNMECEVQQNVELKCEVKIEPPSKKEYKKRIPTAWNESIDIYKEQWDSPRELYPLVKRAFRHIIRRTPGTFLEEVHVLAQRIEFVTSVVNELLKELLSHRRIVLGGIVTALVGYGITLVRPMMPLYILAAVVNYVGRYILSAGSACSILPIGIFVSSKIANYASKVTIRIVKNIKEFYQTDNYVASVRDILRMHLPASHYQFHTMIDKDFYATHNFFQETLTIDSLELQAPFNKEQKPLFQVLLVQDTDKRGNKKLKMVAFDQNDSEFFHNNILKEYEKPEAEIRGYTRKVAIYDMENKTIVLQGQNRFETNELENNPKYHQLLASAKLINGEINFTEQELEYLLAQATPEIAWRIYEYYVSKVLLFHPQKAALFEHSSFCIKLKERIFWHINKEQARIEV